MWEQCSTQVLYKTTDMLRPMMPYYQRLLKDYGIAILVFSGVSGKSLTRARRRVDYRCLARTFFCLRRCVAALPVFIRLLCHSPPFFLCQGAPMNRLRFIVFGLIDTFALFPRTFSCMQHYSSTGGSLLSRT